MSVLLRESPIPDEGGVSMVRAAGPRRCLFTPLNGECSFR